MKRKKNRKKRNFARSARKQARRVPPTGVAAKRRNVRVKTREDRLLWKLVGVALLAAAVFLAVALASFDRAAAAGLDPGGRVSANLVGVIGDAFASSAYRAFGFAAWCLPLAAVCGGLKLLGSIPKEVEEIPNGRVWVRTAGLVLMAVTVSGLFQLAGKWRWIQACAGCLNIGGDAGGKVGYWLVTRGLEKGVAAFGATFLMFVLLAVSVCMAAGLRTVRSWFDALAAIDWGFDDAEEEDAPPRRPETAEPVFLPPKPSGGTKVPPERSKTLPQTKPPRIQIPARGDLPGVDLLDPVPPKRGKTGEAAETGARLIETLRLFGVEASLADTVEGPVVTQYAIIPAPGVRVERITGLTRDLQRALKAKTIRIFAPIPGEDTVGVQIPNKTRETVTFREIVESAAWQDNAVRPAGGAPKIPVPLLLGKNVGGDAVVEDLARMPHLLIAGATGKGKSVCLSAIISGFLMCRTPDQLRLILVDPKGGTEFKVYEDLPHLLVPVVTDVKKVMAALRWAANEMARRQKIIAGAGARDIREYNAAAKTDRMPYIVIVIDELADIMLQAGRDVDPLLSRLMALARATGIHLVLATQRPDVKVIVGTIKANIAGRIAFATVSATDSRTILDEPGAETLIGDGDMLYRTRDGLTVRAQGAFVSRDEKNRIIAFAVRQWPSVMDENLKAELERAGDAGEDASGGDGEVGADEYEKAKQLVVTANRASISYLQRQMHVGYNHAAKIIDLLEARGVIGPAKGAGPRDVLTAE